MSFDNFFEEVKEEFNYEEWGDVDAVKRLYIKPGKLKRLARQMGLPSYLWFNWIFDVRT